MPWQRPYDKAGPAKWVTDIPNGTSGVYLIRDRATKALLYVGESHTGRLRKTFLRHFQKWRGKTAGETYDAEKVEARILKSQAAASLDKQNALILRLNPRDNDHPTADKPGRPANPAAGPGLLNRILSTITPTDDPF